MAYRVSEDRSGSNSTPSPAQEDHPCADCPSSRSVVRAPRAVRLRVEHRGRGRHRNAAPTPRLRAARGERPGRGRRRLQRVERSGGRDRSHPELRVRSARGDGRGRRDDRLDERGLGAAYGDDRRRGVRHREHRRERTAGLVFDAAGTYTYHCNIHPNMTGHDHDPSSRRGRPPRCLASALRDEQAGAGRQVDQRRFGQARLGEPATEPIARRERRALVQLVELDPGNELAVA